MKNILITAVGGDIGQAVIDCLKGTEYADHLYGCDQDEYSAGRAAVKGFVTVPSVKQTTDYAAAIDKIVAELKIEYLIPLNEREVEYFSANLSKYDKKGIKVLVLDRSIVERCLDKYETIMFLQDLGIQVPRTFLPDRYLGELGFPLIAKLRRSCGGKGAAIINDQTELEKYLKQNPGSILQEIVGDQDQEYTVGVFSDGERTYSIAFRRYLGYGSLTKAAHLCDHPEISALAEKIAGAIRLKGPLNIQMRKTEKGFVPFEINPRISSTAYFRHHFGFQDVKWWLDLAGGRKVDYIAKYSSGVGIRTVGAVFFDLKKNGH